MSPSRAWQAVRSSDATVLILLALSRVLLHTLTNGQYGFHRDELTTLDDARHLAWGYVAYPPLAPFIGRIELEMFGTSLTGFRVFAAVAQGVALVLTGLMARELGGKRLAQVVAALAVAIAPLSLASGVLFQYVSFDYLWWVLIAYLVIRLLKSEDPRWWVAIGAVIGLGMETKYTMAFFVAGIVAGVLLTPARRYLKSPWLWCGVALSLLVFLPNLVWQAHHAFISLDFLQYIHGRDIRIGRTSGFLKEQPIVSANPFTVPLWLAGLLYFFIVPDRKRYRLMGWLFVVPFLLFFIAKSRSYYIAPAYPMLLAAGAVLGERWVTSLTAGWARLVRGLTWSGLAVGGLIAAALILPIAPVNTPWWNVVNKGNDAFREEIGWPDLVETVARIRDSLPAAERARVGILAGNYGEAGAIDLYGPAHGLSRALSGINSYWLRGYDDPPPQTLILVGFTRDFAERTFESCALAGHNTNRYGVKNEETTEHPDIFVCRGLRQPWPEFWAHFKYFG
ncbi:MAG: glycosyltransferase family 39 protein [Acidobacteriia bacterium]|nr:glycosyltransferase family 39 protein [Terriglobia bacterium]